MCARSDRARAFSLRLGVRSWRNSARRARTTDPSVSAGLAALARGRLATLASAPSRVAEIYRRLPRRRRVRHSAAELLDAERDSR